LILEYLHEFFDVFSGYLIVLASFLIAAL